VSNGLPNRRSDFRVVKSSTSEGDVPLESGKAIFEIIDTPTLAARLTVPASWIAAHTRSRSRDRIPCMRLGRYVRFRWGSVELEQWLRDHMENS
jgi:hypothetical protein